MFRNKLPVKNTNASVLPRPMESEFPEVISRHPHFKTPEVILKYPRDEDQCATVKFNLYKFIFPNFTNIKILLLPGQSPCSPSLLSPKDKVNLCLHTSAPDFPDLKYCACPLLSV